LTRSTALSMETSTRLGGTSGVKSWAFWTWRCGRFQEYQDDGKAPSQSGGASFDSERPRVESYADDVP
jgi:hypothetical protein